MTDLLFVYGTLQQGFANHHLLNDCDFVDIGVIPNTLLLDLGACPGLVFARADAEEWAKGEVYRVTSPDTVAALDRLENEGSLYRRLIARTRTRQGAMMCWVYTYLLPLGSTMRVPGGRWRR